MKKTMKTLTAALICAMLVLTCACGSETESEGGSAEETEYSMEERLAFDDAIEEYIENKAPAGLGSILASDWLTVYVDSSGETDITIRTLFYYAIPYVADDMISIVQDAIEESGAIPDRFTVTSYQEDNDGVIDDTLSSWSTTNWDSGIYVSNEDGSQISGATIEYLLDYYADYAELIQSLTGRVTE